MEIFGVPINRETGISPYKLMLAAFGLKALVGAPGI
jgi:hypothetical protein